MVRPYDGSDHTESQRVGRCGRGTCVALLVLEQHEPAPHGAVLRAHASTVCDHTIFTERAARCVRALPALTQTTPCGDAAGGGLCCLCAPR